MDVSHSNDSDNGNKIRRKYRKNEKRQNRRTQKKNSTKERKMKKSSAKSKISTMPGREKSCRYQVFLVCKYLCIIFVFFCFLGVVINYFVAKENKKSKMLDIATVEANIYSCSANSFVIGDGVCDETTNTERCLYDGGDCCLENKVTNLCRICTCSVTVSVSDLTKRLKEHQAVVMPVGLENFRDVKKVVDVDSENSCWTLCLDTKGVNAWYYDQQLCTCLAFEHCLDQEPFLTLHEASYWQDECKDTPLDFVIVLYADLIECAPLGCYWYNKRFATFDLSGESTIKVPTAEHCQRECQESEDECVHFAWISPDFSGLLSTQYVSTCWLFDEMSSNLDTLIAEKGVILGPVQCESSVEEPDANQYNLDDDIADNVCDDSMNNADNLYDGGDCCDPTADCSYCTKCLCHVQNSQACANIKDAVIHCQIDQRTKGTCNYIQSNESTSSSSFYPESNGVDQVLVSGTSGAGSFKSSLESKPWYQVDLSSFNNTSGVSVFGAIFITVIDQMDFSVHQDFAHISLTVGNSSMPLMGSKTCATYYGPADYNTVIDMPCTAPIVGKYLNIQRWSDGFSVLAFNEVIVYGQTGPIQNDARSDCMTVEKYGTITSSSMLDNYKPQNSLNNKIMYDNGYAHTTLLDWNAWFQLEFYVPMEVTGILVFTRLDCCPQHFKNVEITVGFSPMSIDDNERSSNPICNYYNGPPSLGEIVSIPCLVEGRVGKYLVLQRLAYKNQYDKALAMTEIKVFGRRAPSLITASSPFDASTNVQITTQAAALTNVSCEFISKWGTPSASSNLGDNFHPTYAVNGLFTTNTGGSIFHSDDIGANDLFQLEFDAEMKVFGGLVLTRLDCCPTQFSEVSIHVGNMKTNQQSLNQECSYVEIPEIPGTVVDFFCHEPLLGRYVVLQKHSTLDPLFSFDELIIFGQYGHAGANDCKLLEKFGIPSVSSVLNGDDYGPDKAIDRHVPMSGGYLHTDMSDQYSWFQLDLGMPFHIDAFLVFTCLEHFPLCQDQFSSISFNVGENPMSHGAESGLSTNPLCNFFEGPPQPGEIIEIPCLNPGMLGQYVTLQRIIDIDMEGNFAMAFIEVKVLGRSLVF